MENTGNPDKVALSVALIFAGICGGILGIGAGYKLGAEKFKASGEESISQLKRQLADAQSETRATDFQLSKAQEGCRVVETDLRTQVQENGKLEDTLATEKNRTKNLAERISAFNDRFLRKDAGQTFSQQLLEFKSTGIGRLEVGTLNSRVTLERSVTKTTAWDWIYLGKTIAKIECPATYRYHVDLNEAWEVKVVNGDCIVKAPQLAASLPVAIHSEKLKKESENAWSSFDKSEISDQAVRALTPTANAQAATAENVNKVYDPARLVVAKFVKAWLLKEGGWGSGKVSSITVYFKDETIPNPVIRPTLNLDPSESTGQLGLPIKTD